MPQADEVEEASRHNRRFEVLCEVYKLRDFELVLSATVSGYAGEWRVRTLEAVAREKVKTGFDGFFPEPPVQWDCGELTVAL